MSDEVIRSRFWQMVRDLHLWVPKMDAPAAEVFSAFADQLDALLTSNLQRMQRTEIK